MGDVKMMLHQRTKHDTLLLGESPKEVYDMVMIRKKHQMETVTNPFQRRRMEVGLRQKDLAEAINRPVSYIGKIENETININNVSMGNGYKIARVLGCRMEDLVNKDALE